MKFGVFLTKNYFYKKTDASKHMQYGDFILFLATSSHVKEREREREDKDKGTQNDLYTEPITGVETIGMSMYEAERALGKGPM